MSEKEDVNAVKMLVRAREDFQGMRKRMDNRIGRKANGEKQKVQERVMRFDDLETFKAIADNAKEQENFIQKKLKKVLKRFNIYNEWLVDVKGIGEIASGWIIGEYDIHKATTVSKLWQFTGLNPGMVRGIKRIKKEKYKESNGEIIGEMFDDVFVRTNKMVRGDKLTEGFVAPFNKNLRRAMVGVMADGFIKQQNSYALEYYYPYKMRLEQEQNEIVGEDKKWCEVSKGRRDRAAKRYMVKMFLKDLYVIWRQLEGLPVRAPYMEEYLGKKHAA